ncbi:excalibur calcium-binding domain-containing protein [Lysobacter sp. GCM10012299]|uniref:excalibur calcium-binding domain-containing protein n=1 Tax=Lysobacter sp. GCM10012299 TaxID=3317333 RepID=UPI00360E2BD1
MVQQHFLKLILLMAACAALQVTVVDPAAAHDGGVRDAFGCNWNKSLGYHCHPSEPAPDSVSETVPGARKFKNCDAAKKAGILTIRKGDAAYARHLDDDGDGIACK